MKMEPLDIVPLWGILVASCLLVLLAIEGGYWLGKLRRRTAQGEKESPVGAMVAGMLGLLAFLLAFTFSLAANRFDERRQVVLNEANAIGTTYLRAGMLPAPFGEETRQLLREYVDVRLDAVIPDRTAAAVTRSEQIHEELWTRAVAVTREDRSPVAALFVESLNELIDLHARRKMAGLRSRIPVSIWLAVFSVTTLAMGVVGYLEGLSNSLRSPAVIALAMTFAIVIGLIADLDRPGEGLLRVGQQTMIDLKMSIRDLTPNSSTTPP